MEENKEVVEETTTDESEEEVETEWTEETETEEETDYKALYEETLEQKDKRKARAKKWKAKAKSNKTDVEDLEELVEKKVQAVREREQFVSDYPDADISIVKDLADDMGISLKEAHVLNEFRNWKQLEETTKNKTWVHGTFRKSESKTTQRQQFESAVPWFMQ